MTTNPKLLNNDPYTILTKDCHWKTCLKLTQGLKKYHDIALPTFWDAKTVLSFIKVSVTQLVLPTGCLSDIWGAHAFSISKTFPEHSYFKTATQP